MSIWLTAVKECQSFSSHIHHRPKRSCSDLRQCCMCWGGGRKKYKMSNITEQFSFWLLPELGGPSVHLVSHSCSSLCFTCSPAGPDGTLMLSISWPQGYLLLLCLGMSGEAGRNKNGAPWPHSGLHVQWDRTCHKLGARRCPLFLSFPIRTPSRLLSHPGVAVSFWQPWAPALQWDCLAFTAKGSAAPSLCAALLRTGMGQAFPGVSWGDRIRHTPVSVRVCTPMQTLFMFSGTKIIFHQRLEVST